MHALNAVFMRFRMMGIAGGLTIAGVVCAVSGAAGTFKRPR
jgi:hypothetical protein